MQARPLFAQMREFGFLPGKSGKPCRTPWQPADGLGIDLDFLQESQYSVVDREGIVQVGVCRRVCGVGVISITYVSETFSVARPVADHPGKPGFLLDRLILPT